MFRAEHNDLLRWETGRPHPRKPYMLFIIDQTHPCLWAFNNYTCSHGYRIEKPASYCRASSAPETYTSGAFQLMAVSLEA